MTPSARRWLVTGAGGQLGRSILALAPGLGIEAIGMDRLALDVTDEAAVGRVLDEVRPDVLLNAAAFTAVDLCETKRAEAERVNAIAPGQIARLCKGRILLLQLSSEYVFSGDASRPLAEDAPTGPLSVYGHTKLAAERAVVESGCEHLIVRTQWVFGPGANFVRSVLGVARSGRDLRVVEDQVGRPTWSAALARGIVAAAEGGARGLLHLACEGVASWYDVAVQVVAEAARRGLMAPVAVEPIATEAMPRPAPRPSYGVLGIDRARRAGIRLPHWREALVEYLDAEEERRDA